MTNIDELRDAVEILANSTEYSILKRDVVMIAKTTHGVFPDSLAPLTAITNLIRNDDREKAERLFALVDRKRRENNRDELPGSFDKSEYQRAYMARQRTRWTQALKLYQKVTGTKLPELTERNRIRDKIQACWMRRRDEVRQSNSIQTRQELEELTRLFWEEVEGDLERGLAGDIVTARHVLGLDGE